MRIAIVEDEQPARDKLRMALLSAEPDVQIIAELSGVSETIAWLARNSTPDLMFLDIQLSDGLCFEILRGASVRCPVIFATAYDEFLLEAFASTGIDYLLKPIRPERLAIAVEKYRGLKRHFTGGYETLLAALDQSPRRRERVLVRKGLDYIPVRAEDIAYVFTVDKLVFLVTDAGMRYVLDRPLAELEGELDPARFFRANRAWLVHIDAVARCRPCGKGKLLLNLRPPVDNEVVVSQERAAAFRAWLGE